MSHDSSTIFLDNESEHKAGLSQFLAKQLTLSQPGGTDYAHHSTMSPPGFSDLATGLDLIQKL